MDDRYERSQTPVQPGPETPPLVASPPPQPVRREEAPTQEPGVVIEIVGYVGAALIVLALAMGFSDIWDDMSGWARVIALGVVAVVLVVVGAVVSVDRWPAAARLRSVLWTASVPAIGLVGGIGAQELFSWGDQVSLVVGAAFATVAAAVLWSIWTRHLLHIATVASIATLAGSAAFLFDEGTLAGVAVWGVGAVWYALAWGNVVRSSELGLALGAIAMIVGAMMALAAGMGSVNSVWLPLATVILTVGLAVFFRDLVLLIISAIGALQLMPPVVSQLFPSVFSAAIALLVVGAILVAAAIAVARWRATHESEAGRPYRFEHYRRGSRTVAVPLATGVGLATAAAVVVGGIIVNT